MENFPTPKLSAVPRIANLMTLAFLAGTTWWSSAQRPAMPEPSLALQTVQASSGTHVTANAPKPAPAARPALAAPVSNDNLVTVSFTGASVR